MVHLGGCVPGLGDWWGLLAVNERTTDGKPAPPANSSPPTHPLLLLLTPFLLSFLLPAWCTRLRLFSCHLLCSLLYQAPFLPSLVLPHLPGSLPVTSCTPWYTRLLPVISCTPWCTRLSSCYILYSRVYQAVFLSSLVLPGIPCSIPVISCTPWCTRLLPYLLYSLLDHAPFLPSLVLFVTL